MASSYDLLTFRIDEQLYAIAVDPVVQIISMATITPIPQIDGLAEGILNVHGTAVPVVDLRRILGKPRRQYHFHTPIILIKIIAHLVGLIVDSVDEVVSIPAAGILDPADILPQELRAVSLLNGVAYPSDEAALILDPDGLLQPHQIQVLSEASEFLIGFANSRKLKA